MGGGLIVLEHRDAISDAEKVEMGDWVTVMNVSENELYEFVIGGNYYPFLEEACIGKEKRERIVLFGQVYMIDYIAKKDDVFIQKEQAKEKIIIKEDKELDKRDVLVEVDDNLPNHEVIQWFVRKILGQRFCVDFTTAYASKLFYIGRLIYEICVYKLLFEELTMEIEQLKIIRMVLDDKTIVSLSLDEVMDSQDLEQLQNFECELSLQLQIIGYLYEKLGVDFIYGLFSKVEIKDSIDEQIKLLGKELLLELNVSDNYTRKYESYEEMISDVNNLTDNSQNVKETLRVLGKLYLALIAVKISDDPKLFVKIGKGRIETDLNESEKKNTNVVKMVRITEIIGEINTRADNTMSKYDIEIWLEKIGYNYILKSKSTEIVIDSEMMKAIEYKVGIIEQQKYDRRFYRDLMKILQLHIYGRKNKQGQGGVYEISTENSNLDFYCLSETVGESTNKIHIFYEYFMLPLEQLFSGEETWIPERILLIFIDCIKDCRKELLYELAELMPIFDFRNVTKCGIEKYAQILKTIGYLLKDDERFEILKRNLLEINSHWLFIYNKKVYLYENVFLEPRNYKEAGEDNIILDFIVNPTEDIKKKLILNNYRKILDYDDNELEKYALKIHDNTYNLLANIRLKQPIKETPHEYNRESIQSDFLISGDFLKGSTSEIYVLNSDNDVSKQICGLFNEIDVVNIYVASGYVFQSGLNLLSSIFASAKEKQVIVDLLAGSLQKYNTCLSTNSILLGMDKLTARTLNRMLGNHTINLYTIEEQFYHGKMYYFEGKEKSAVIMGSSNVSQSAYQVNYELNIAFVLSNQDNFLMEIKEWIQKVRGLSTQIFSLDEDVFADKEIKLEVLDTVDIVEDIQRKIDALMDEELKYRLNLWMSYKPSVALEGLNIEALPEYIVFVFDEYKMIVLESFEAGNSYFCLKYDGEYQHKLKQIAGMSKTEIFNCSHMEKRGYHISNKVLLEKTVRRYFE